MSGSLRVGLLIASIVVFSSILFTISKKKLNLKYSIIWLLWALLTLIMAVFPETFYLLSDLLGIQMPVNTVFLIMIALLYVLNFYLFITISKQNEEIINLTYNTSILKKELDKKNNER